MKTTTGSRSCVETRHARAELAQLLWRSRFGDRGISRAELAGFSYNGATATAIISAGRHWGTVVLAGEIHDDLNLRIGPQVNLVLDAVVHGAVDIDAAGGSISILGRVVGRVTIHGPVESSTGAFTADEIGYMDGGGFYVAETLFSRPNDEVLHHIRSPALQLPGTFVARVWVRGKVGSLDAAGTFMHGLEIDGSIEGSLRVRGSLREGLSINGNVGGGVELNGSVDVCRVARRVGGSLQVDAKIDDMLFLLPSAAIDGNLTIDGTVRGQVRLDGQVAGDFGLNGSAGELILQGRFLGRTLLAPHMETSLVSVRGARFAEAVFLDQRVNIERCDLRQNPDLSKFVFLASNVRRLSQQPDADQPPISNSEMASIYRQLRSNLEGRNNRAASGVFYRGEMNSRLRASIRSRRFGETAILGTYWALSGYGLSALRALLSFVGAALLGTILLMRGGLELEGGLGSSASFGEALRFTVQSMVSFFSPPDAALRASQEWIQLGLRFLGPVILAQVILAVRERVAR